MRLEEAFANRQTDLHIVKKIIKYENNLNYVKYLCTYKSAVV